MTNMKKKRPIYKNLKAGALYYAVFITFMVSLISGFLLLNAYVNNLFIQMETKRGIVINNVNSGLNYLLANAAQFNYNTEREISLFEGEDNMVTLGKKKWGGYDILKSSSSWRDFTYGKTALAGIYLTENDRTALYLADHEKYLSVSGRTAIVGNSYLPKLGIRRAYIEGLSFEGEKMVDGEILNSDNKLPAFNRDLAKFIDACFNNINLISDDIEDIYNMRSASLHGSFDGKTKIFYSEGAVNLGHLELTGNIIVISGKRIIVENDLKPGNIIIAAPNIYFEEGFEGHIQAFAKDTIVVEDGCTFNFPGLLGIYNTNLNACLIDIGRDVTIHGGVFFTRTEESPVDSKLYTDIGTIIYGQVYFNGTVEIKGEIYGSLFCDEFFLRTEAAYYENHLLDATINAKDIPGYFLGYSLLEKEYTYQILEWLN